MNLLALETSTIACSVALLYDGRVFERHVVKPKEHTRLLIPMIRAVLADGGAGLSDLDAIIPGNGPGSFIGMRIAASVAQGLAYGANLKLVPVSSLAAVAAETFHRTAADNVIVAQDAHMNEVYVARFEKGKQGLPVADGDAVLQPVARIEGLEGGGAPRWHAAGAGWQRYPELLQLNADRLAGTVDVLFPQARFLLAAGEAAWQAGAATDPGGLVPDYVRSRVASMPGARRP
ncbi:MAG: tRNA (adenosine(37)-N6)-threonylcarbamoyltransferase complex dimerization subunit type 1 TsaB [Woeseia sp.]